jgi:GDP/UDP-N,N'-diacetylbacillosamine 2-epimerase (hydrolysing)
MNAPAKRKICVVTGSRAEYGLLRWLIAGIRDSADLELQVIATGMHLAAEFGNTYREIEGDGFVIDRKVDIGLADDTPAGIARSMGLGLSGFGQALAELKPDVMLVLGDRFEIFSAVSAALVARIPVAHLHGGERTEGAFDEAIRHAMTKMSHLHFVAAEEYRKRVIQLGEQPERVFLVGGLGIDSIKRTKLMARAELEQSLGIKFGARNLLVTFHPVTLDDADPAEQMAELLAALESRGDTQLIFTMPNADTGGRALIAMVEQFVAAHANAHAFTSLGHLRYLSCIAQVDGMVGNSSSGLIEVPTFHKGTVNIGDRQRGRLKADSVIDCEPQRQAIAAALDQLYSEGFQSTLKSVRNPYGDGGACDKIVQTLRTVKLESILKKSFRDMPASAIQ